MRKIRINHTNLEASPICIGGGGFGSCLKENEVFEVLDKFYQAGGNFIDTARAYCSWIPGMEDCSELAIGKWLRKRKVAGKILVATKGGHYDFAAPDISRVNEESVRRDLDKSRKLLGLDVIDLYWLHRDNENRPIEEIIDFMEALVREGQIRYYGASNYSVKRLKKASEYADSKNYQGFSAVSNQWSLAEKTKAAIGGESKSLVTVNFEERCWHEQTQTPLIPYSAAAGGFFEKLYRSSYDYKNNDRLKDLTFRLYWNNRNLLVYNDMLKLNKEMGYSFTAMSIAYLLKQGFPVFPVCGLGKKEQLAEILKAAELNLPEEMVRRWKGLLVEE